MDEQDISRRWEAVFRTTTPIEAPSKGSAKKPWLIKTLASPVERLIRNLIFSLRTSANIDNSDRVMQPLNCQGSEFDSKARFYYENFRKEVDRENDITFKRLNAALNLQWFLIASAAAIVAATISAAKDGDLSLFLKLFAASSVLSISLLGSFSCLFAFRGIEAARNSLTFAKDQWVAFNRINGGLKGGLLYPSEYPQPTKRANTHSWDGLLREGKPLTPKELIAGDFYGCDNLREERRQRIRTGKGRDDGFDFALAVPALMFVFWGFVCCLVLLFCFVILLSYFLGYGACPEGVFRSVCAIKKIALLVYG